VWRGGLGVAYRTVHGLSLPSGELEVLPLKIISQPREKARRVYNSAVLEIKKEIPDETLTGGAHTSPVHHSGM
jgi:hypothetical protein